MKFSTDVEGPVSEENDFGAIVTWPNSRRFARGLRGEHHNDVTLQMLICRVTAPNRYNMMHEGGVGFAPAMLAGITNSGLLVRVAKTDGANALLQQRGNWYCSPAWTPQSCTPPRVKLAVQTSATFTT